MQQQTTGHRGRKGDPLYAVRKLLLVARDKLTDRANDRLRAAWQAGDPYHAVEVAWMGRELLRDVYAANDLAAAERTLDEFLAWADRVAVPGLDRLAGTIRHWRSWMLAYHHRRLTNGRTEAMNLLVKRVKRLGFGFRNFANYRTRLLLHAGTKWETPPTAIIRAAPAAQRRSRFSYDGLHPGPVVMSTMRTAPRGVTVLALVMCWLVASAGTGWAHASFVTSHPEPGADLAAAPGVVTLRFSEPLIEDLSQVTVTDPSGRQFTAGPTGAREIQVDVNSTAQGEYTVEWRTVSPIDGHTLHGAFEFGVGAQVAHQDAPSDTPAAGDMLVAAARAVEYAGLLAALGLLSLAALAKKDGLPWAPQRLQRWAAVAAAGGTLTVAGELLLAASGSPFAAAASTFLLAPSGIPRLGRMLTELTAAAITVRAARRAGTGAVPQRSMRVWAALLTLASLALLSAAGHAAAWGFPGILADAGHLWAAGVWAGGLIVMAFHRPPGGWQGEAGRQLIRRFSPLALTMFSATVLFGSVRSWQELGHLSDLSTTSYGEVLTVKIVLVVTMLPLSRLAWHRERPHLRAEGLLAVGVVLAAAALAAFPSPPGRADESAAGDAGQEEPDLPVDGDVTMAEGAGTTVVGMSIRPAEPGVNDVYAHLIPVSGADMAEALDARIAVDGDEQAPMRHCGTSCRAATVPLDGGERVDITVSGADGGTATFALPELPAPDGSDLASRLTSRMQQVDTLRYDEVFGPHDPPTTSTWEIVAPDRLHGVITGGADFYETIRIGDRRWRRDTPDGAWQGGEPGGISVKANRFIWDYDGKTAARIVGTGTVDGVETRIVSFFLRQGGLSIWYRLWVDDDDRVRQAEMRTQGHFMDHRYYDYNEDIDIRPPG